MAVTQDVNEAENRKRQYSSFPGWHTVVVAD
jgi:hypothetical protein